MRRHRPRGGPPRRPPALSALVVLLLALTAPSGRAQAAAVDGVRTDRDSFNPGLGQKVTLSYRLTAADRVWVRVYDPDGGLVRTVVDGERQEAGDQKATWDGRDGEGRTVPDEAYSFTVETGSGEVYDPTTTSGGEVGDLTDARFDRQAGTMNYVLPAASRLLVRLGVRNGPMYKTLVDWKPRVAGTVTEYWDGRDEDGLVTLWGHPDFSALITYVTLPDSTVIAYGNSAESYRDDKLGRGKDRPQKPARQPAAGAAKAPDAAVHLRPQGLVPPAWSRAPRVSLSFPQLGEASAVPAVSGDVAVRVEVAPEDRELLLRDQFEIIFYVDDVFFAEAERGYLPLNWSWETTQLPAGEHVLTVNVASFQGQVGVASRKVRVEVRTGR